MKIRKVIIFLILFMSPVILTIESIAASALNPPKPKDNEVEFYFDGVGNPLKRILLIRKDSNYCAVRFTSYWTEVDEERRKEYAKHIAAGGEVADLFREESEKKYAIYDSFYQGDGTGDFANKNVQESQGKAYWLPPKGPFRLFIYQPGDPHVKCGPYTLEWRYKTYVSVVPHDKHPEDYGFEIAPTPWTDIKEVNVKDPRIKWYRYDEKRERIFIPIDKLWEKE
jgi:hypothetical protein